MLKNKKFIFYLNLSIILLLVVIIFIFHINEKCSSDIISLDNSWQYRIGDSPKDSNGSLNWLDNHSPDDWIKVENFSDIPTKGFNSIWIKTVLPDTLMNNSSLLLVGVRQITQVYLNGEKIYQTGDFSDISKQHFMGWYKPLINLPENCAKGTLTFRIWSSESMIGILPPIQIASTDKLLKYLFISNVDEFILITIFMFLAVIILSVILFFRKDRLLFGIVIFLFGISVFIGSNSTFLMTLFYSPRLFLMLDFYSLLTLAIGGLYLTEQIISKEFKSIIRRLWQIQLLLLMTSFVPIILIRYNIIKYLYLGFFLLAPVNAMLLFFIIASSMKKGNKETRLLFIGMTIFFSSAILELIIHFTIKNSFHINLMQFGAFGFVICLVLIVINHYFETHRQKEIAQKRALESEKFRELDKLKSQFFANISHEFRTPLTLILGTAKQVLKDATSEFIKSKSKLQIKHGRRLLNLVNELLELSKIDAGKMVIKIHYKDILQQVRDMYNQFESYAVSKQIKMVMISDLAEALLYYDSEKIDKVLYNLISNALKFTPSNGKISISVTQNDNLEIKISDTGPGIAKEHLPYIFDRFYQAGDNNISDQQGSGIGLALANELIRLHHGKIIVESTVGKGSIFTIQLQLGLDHFTKEELVPATKIDQAENIKQKIALEENSNVKTTSQVKLKKKSAPIILIIEDNNDLRNYIHEELVENYQLIEAENGQVGFELATKHIPDLIISDVMMPVMNGFRLCENLKTDERTSHIPIVLLTARSDAESKMNGLSLGADDYLTKPFESDELKIRIHNLIEQRRKLRQKFSREITTPISEISVMPTDEQFFKRFTDIILSNLDNAEITVDWLCEQLGLSRSQLHRKIKALTDLSTSEFIRSIRLKEAIKFQEKRSGTISEIAYKTGFGNPDYFRRCFKKQFGVPPSEYLSGK